LIGMKYKNIIRGFMTIRGLVFDFDGLILDTETPEYQVLQEMFHEQGVDLPLEKWAQALGASFKAFNPIDYLIELSQKPLDKDVLLHTFKKNAMELIEMQPPMAGVVSLLEDARRNGIKLAVASSSPAEWVNTHLTRLNLMDYFEVILSGSDVTHVKPDPELYLRAAEELKILPSEAIALEDSPNGITAARSAGMYCLAVLNSVTRCLDTSHASQVVESLADISLEELLEAARCQAAN
jgi:HAD superfamily hydrolase (TIGR01509 family)